MQFDYAQWLKARYKPILVAACIGVMLSSICYAVCPRKYAATATLLVQQLEAKPVHVANESTNTYHDERDDYVATQLGVISSPIVIERAIATLGIENCPSVVGSIEPIEAIIKNLRVTRPDRTAKILTIEYHAKTRVEATKTLGAILDSYTNYVSNDLYKATQSKIVSLILSKQGDVRGELDKVETQYVEFMRAHPGLSVARTGKSPNSERLLRWVTAASDVELRQIRVAAQIKLAKSLLAGGTKTWGVAFAIGELGDSNELLRSIDVRTMQHGDGDYLRSLIAEQQKVAEEIGPNSSKAVALQEKIQSLQDRASPTSAAESKEIIASMEQVLARINGVRTDLQAKYDADLKAVNNDEVALLEEEALKSRLDRTRAVFNTLLDTLKQAQLNSEYNAVSTSVLESPNASIHAVSPKLLNFLAMGLVLGGAIGVIFQELSFIPVRRRLMLLKEAWL